MKKTILTFAALLLIVAPALADTWKDGAGYSGGTMYLSQTGNEAAGRGGEFTLQKDGTAVWLSNAAYADVAKNQGGKTDSFQTFCIETGEFIASPTHIWVSTESTVEGTPGSHSWVGGVPGTGDDLDQKTAWLYTQFATGNLATLGYNYTPGAGRIESAGALQRLIWSIEGEGGDVFTTSYMNITLNNAQRTLINTWNTAYSGSGWSGIGNVRVLQTDRSGGMGQDQLYLVPAPAAIGLGMLGLGLVGWYMRRYA